MRSFQVSSVVLLVLVWLGVASAVEVLDSDRVFTANVSVKVGKKESEREISCLNGAAGVLKTKKGKLTFTSYQETLRKFKKKIKAGGNVGLNKLRLIKGLRKAGMVACATPPDDTPPTPTPTPGVTPTPDGTPGPTATPTPTPSYDPDANFDLLGNVTPKGKSEFHIPAQMEANVNDGLSVFRDLGCDGCHEAKINRTFDYLRLRTSGDPMYFSTEELPDQALAHLTAYLNRFNQR